MGTLQNGVRKRHFKTAYRAPFGELAAKTLKVSTYAIESDTAGDATYKNLESQSASWTAQRDGSTAQIQSMLGGAEFKGNAAVCGERRCVFIDQQAGDFHW